MSPRELPCAASTLTAPLLDGAASTLVEVARTPVSVHYETGMAAFPVLCVCTPAAIRLPNAVVTETLPAGLLVAGDGMLCDGPATWRVHRWWAPPAPRGLPVPQPVPGPAADPRPEAGFSVPHSQHGARPPYDWLDPDRLVGAGPGLTPSGDDVLAAALVSAHATDDPRLPGWLSGTRAALVRRTTTAVSRGLLHASMAGYAAPPLAGCLEAVCRDWDADDAVRRLVAVGHSSGAALWYGVRQTLQTRFARRAAA